MSFQKRSFYLRIDPELRVVHSTTDCPVAKIGIKYNYLESVTITTSEDAEKLDARGLRPCDWCLKRERNMRKRAHRTMHESPPGFRH